MTPHEQPVFAALAPKGVPIVVPAPTVEHDSRRGYATPAESRPTLQRIAGLGDFPAPTSASDGYLLHVLSDQQWGLHRLLYIDRAGTRP